MTDTLRLYQTDAIAKIQSAIAAGERRILLVAPTGSGKTVIGAEVIADYTRRYRPVVVLAHRREIITQTSEKLQDIAIPHGIIMAGSRRGRWSGCKSPPSNPVGARHRSETMELPPADLLVIDEWHHAAANTYRKIIDAYPDAMLLGLTATPCRGDGRGLGGIFEVHDRMSASRGADRAGVPGPDAGLCAGRSRSDRRAHPAGDYVESELADRMDRPQADRRHRHALAQVRRAPKDRRLRGQRRALVHLRDEFIQSGVRAEHIDGSTPKPERDAIARAPGIRRDRARHQLHGADRRLGHAGGRLLHPGAADQEDGPLSADDRPRAAPGRGQERRDRARSQRRRVPPRLRRGPGRVDARSRSPRRRARRINKRASSHASRLLECSQCGAIRVGGEPCPHCGFLPQRPAAACVDPRRRARPRRSAHAARKAASTIRRRASAGTAC